MFNIDRDFLKRSFTGSRVIVGDSMCHQGCASDISTEWNGGNRKVYASKIDMKSVHSLLQFDKELSPPSPWIFRRQLLLLKSQKEILLMSIINSVFLAKRAFSSSTYLHRWRTQIFWKEPDTKYYIYIKLRV